MPGVGAGPPPPLPSGEPVPAAGPGPPHHAGPAHDPAAPPGDDRSVHRCSPLPMAFHTVAVKHPCTASTRVCIGSETAPCVTVLVHCHQELVVDSVELILEDTGRARCLAEELKGCDGTDEGKERMADGEKKHFQHVYPERVETGSSRIYGKHGGFDSSFIYIGPFFLSLGKRNRGERRSQLRAAVVVCKMMIYYYHINKSVNI